MLTPRRRVEIALDGGRADKVPFTAYENNIPQCAVERALRNRGLCVCVRSAPVTRGGSPNVKTEDHTYTDEKGRRVTRTVYETPVGSVSTLTENAGYTIWRHERMFKTPDDYKVIRFLIEDQQVEAAYDRFLQAQAAYGEDGVFRANIGLEPLQTLISGGYLDMQTFCVEWMMNRDEILRLYRAVVEQRRRMYRLIAESPVGHANYGGNVTPEIVGPDMYREYYLPHYREAAEEFRKTGTKLGSHYDANCGVLRELIAEAPLDYIEAFTPAPDTDMSLADARAAWPDKVLWINFPSSVHLKPDSDVRAAALDLLDQAGRPDGLIFGITETVPEDRWQGSFTAIMDGLEHHAAQHPDLYA